DQLLVMRSGTVLHVPAAIALPVSRAVEQARAAFPALTAANHDAITRFFQQFAARLADDAVWAAIAAANEGDVRAARARDRSTTRLEAGARMRGEMIRGLKSWEAMPSARADSVVNHEG